MKSHKTTIIGLSASFVFVTQAAQGALVLEESFDYAAGSAIVGQSGGIGWGAAWTGVTAAGAGVSNVVAGADSTFGTLETAGGSLERIDRAGRGVVVRTISTASQGSLTADGSTVWFSVLVDPTINLTGTGGQPSNAYASLVFGSEGLTDASIGTQNGVGTDIANSGDGVGVGFFGGTTNADIGIQGVTFTGGAIDQSDGGINSIVTGDTLSFIVGRIDWAANGTNDTITLFNVTDPAAALPSAFSTQTLDVDQTQFDTISISDGQTAGFDEIRFGATLADVTPLAIPEPSSLSLLALASLALLRRRK